MAQIIKRRRNRSPRSRVARITSAMPFGLPVLKTSSDATNKYQYNGKENNGVADDTETGWQDYSARMYMPEIGRFGTVDRYAEKYYGLSSYQYGANNPLRFIDVNGDSLNIAKSLMDNKIAYNAYMAFANTKQGKHFFSQYASKGQKIGNSTATKDGKYHTNGINLAYESGNIGNPDTAGETGSKSFNNGMDITVSIDNDSKRNIEDNIITFFHESFIHAEIITSDYRDDNLINNSTLGLTSNQKRNAQGLVKHFQHIKVLDDYRKYGFSEKNTNLWPLQAIRGIIEANTSLGIHSNTSTVFKKMWHYEGGLEVGN